MRSVSPLQERSSYRRADGQFVSSVDINPSLHRQVIRLSCLGYTEKQIASMIYRVLTMDPSIFIGAEADSAIIEREGIWANAVFIPGEDDNGLSRLLALLSEIEAEAAATALANIIQFSPGAAYSVRTLVASNTGVVRANNAYEEYTPPLSDPAKYLATAAAGIDISLLWEGTMRDVDASDGSVTIKMNELGQVLGTDKEGRTPQEIISALAETVQNVLDGDEDLPEGQTVTNLINEAIAEIKDILKKKNNATRSAQKKTARRIVDGDREPDGDNSIEEKNNFATEFDDWAGTVSDGAARMKGEVSDFMSKQSEWMGNFTGPLQAGVNKLNSAVDQLMAIPSNAVNEVLGMTSQIADIATSTANLVSKVAGVPQEIYSSLNDLCSGLSDQAKAVYDAGKDALTTLDNSLALLGLGRIGLGLQSKYTPPDNVTIEEKIYRFQTLEGRVDDGLRRVRITVHDVKDGALVLTPAAEPFNEFIVQSKMITYQESVSPIATSDGYIPYIARKRPETINLSGLVFNRPATFSVSSDYNGSGAPSGIGAMAAGLWSSLTGAFDGGGRKVLMKKMLEEFYMKWRIAEASQANKILRLEIRPYYSTSDIEGQDGIDWNIYYGHLINLTFVESSDEFGYERFRLDFLRADGYLGVSGKGGNLPVDLRGAAMVEYPDTEDAATAAQATEEATEAPAGKEEKVINFSAEEVADSPSIPPAALVLADGTIAAPLDPDLQAQADTGNLTLEQADAVQQERDFAAGYGGSVFPA